MSFVLDASVALAWAFHGERQSPASTALGRARLEETWVPSLWWFEVRNVLIVGERRGRLTEAETGEFLRYLSQLRIVVDHAPNDPAVLRLARQYRLSVYDAAYLELALRAAMPLATLDTDLLRAARAEKVPIIS